MYNATDTAARLAALLARRDEMVRRHEAEHGQGADGDVVVVASARRPAGSTPRVTQGHNAPTAGRLSSGRPLTRGEQQSARAGKVSTYEEILRADADACDALHPIASAGDAARSPTPQPSAAAPSLDAGRDTAAGGPSSLTPVGLAPSSAPASDSLGHAGDAVANPKVGVRAPAGMVRPCPAGVPAVDAPAPDLLGRAAGVQSKCSAQVPPEMAGGVLGGAVARSAHGGDAAAPSPDLSVAAEVAVGSQSDRVPDSSRGDSPGAAGGPSPPGQPIRLPMLRARPTPEEVARKRAEREAREAEYFAELERRRMAFRGACREAKRTGGPMPWAWAR